jgi:hypothetical protein
MNIDGISVDDLVTQWRPIYADSNDAARMRDIGQYLTRGSCAAEVVGPWQRHSQSNCDPSARQRLD